MKINKGATLDVNFYKNPLTGSNNSHFGYWATVKDSDVRSKAPGFNGLEKPYAMVPSGVGADGTVKRERVDFQYRNDLSQPGQKDVYVGDRFENTSPALIKKYGVQLFLDTNVGQIQAPTQKKLEQF